MKHSTHGRALHGSEGLDERQLFEKQVMCAELSLYLGENTFWPRLERVNKASEMLGMVKEDFDSKRKVTTLRVVSATGSLQLWPID